MILLLHIAIASNIYCAIYAQQYIDLYPWNQGSWPEGTDFENIQSYVRFSWQPRFYKAQTSGRVPLGPVPYDGPHTEIP